MHALYELMTDFNLIEKQLKRQLNYFRLTNLKSSSRKNQVCPWGVDRSGSVKVGSVKQEEGHPGRDLITIKNENVRLDSEK